MFILYGVLLIAHVLSASIWVGGATMQEFVLNPKLRTISGLQGTLVSKRAESILTIMVWTSLSIGIASGIALGILFGMIPEVFLFFTTYLMEPETLPLVFGMILSGVIVINGIFITFYVAPMAKQIKSEGMRLRSSLKLLIRLNNILGIAVIVLMTIFAQIPLL